MQRKTKIIATISSLNCSRDFIEGLYRAGMNVVRLNTAHMTHDDALLVVENTRAVSEKIGILLDTKGPEIRTCDARAPLTVRHGESIRLKGDPNAISRDDIIFVSHKGFVKDVPVGSSVLIDDGTVALAVMDQVDDFLVCHVENDGVIHPRKSVNIPSVHVKLPALSEKDRGFIEFAADHHLDFIAHSFVRNKEDVLAVQEILDKKNLPSRSLPKLKTVTGWKTLMKFWIIPMAS